LKHHGLIYSDSTIINLKMSFMLKTNNLFSLFNISIAFLIIIFDLIIYIVLGTILMNYDDSYEESKGIYWSYESMTSSEILSSYAFAAWNLINLIFIGFILYKLIKYLKKKKINKTKSNDQASFDPTNKNIRNLLER